MNNSCISTGNKYNFTINIMLHICILFLILSLFFMLYVSKLVKSTLDQQLTDLIENNLEKSLNTLTAQQQKILKKALKEIPLDNLIKLYSLPDNTTQTYNNWLFIMIISVNVFLFILTIALITAPYVTANRCVPIKFILLENISIFIFVGIVEFLFFTFIAIKYIPAPPSLMITSIIKGIKKYL